MGLKYQAYVGTKLSYLLLSLEENVRSRKSDAYNHCAGSWTAPVLRDLDLWALKGGKCCHTPHLLVTKVALLESSKEPH